jgi:ABC-type branched-subunit amino acid transport system ATPase component
MIETRDLTKMYGVLYALNRLNLTLNQGDVYGFIGPNGAGKTTIFNLVTGALRPDHGTVAYAGRDITGLRPDQVAGAGIARTYQDLRLFGRLSCEENVMVAFPGQPGERVAAALFQWGRVQRREA